MGIRLEEYKKNCKGNNHLVFEINGWLFSYSQIKDNDGSITIDYAPRSILEKLYNSPRFDVPELTAEQVSFHAPHIAHNFAKNRQDTDLSISNLKYNSVETLPGFEARAAFTVNSATVFREDVDIVPTIVDDTLSYVPLGGDNL